MHWEGKIGGARGHCSRKLWRRKGRAALRAAIEPLESRVLFTTIVVTTNADSGAGSLRAAITQAANGDSINFATALSGQTITLGSALPVITQPITIQAPTGGIAIDGNSKFTVFEIDNAAGVVTLNGLTIQHGSAANGGGVLVDSGADASLGSCTLTANSATGASGVALGSAGTDAAGGGLYASAAIVALTGCTFSANSATGGAGGIGLAGGAGSGGGVYASNTTLTVSGCTFTSNTTTGGAGGSSGGGGGFASGGGLYAIGGTASFSGSAFSSNSAIGGNDGGATAISGTAAGGGLYDTFGSSTLTNCTFSSNIATGGSGSTANGSNDTAGSGLGAGFYGSGSQTLVSCTFTANAASGGNALGRDGIGAAGAFYLASGNIATLTGCMFNSNSASGGSASSSVAGVAYGGAIFADEGSSTFNSCAFAGNSAHGGGAVAGEIAGAGGGIYALSARITLNQCTFNTDTAQGGDGAGSQIGRNGGDAAGGGVYITGSSFGGSLTIAGGSFSNETATGGSAGGGTLGGGTGGAGSGGGIYATRATVSISGSTFTSDLATGGGGGGSNSPGAAGPGGAGSGGGLYLSVSSGSPSITNCVFSTDSATGGGGGTTTGGVTSNTGGIGSGGGLYASGGAPIITGGTFGQDTAAGGAGGVGGAGTGGGLYLSASTGYQISSTFFTTNSATGGAVGANITAGTGGAGAAGGAYVSTSSGSPTLSNCTFVQNNTTGGSGGNTGLGGAASGGGLDVYGGSPTLSNCAFNVNIATGGAGGPNGVAGVVGGAGAGGGLYANTSFVSVNTTTFTQNSAIGGNSVFGNAVGTGGNGIGGGVDAYNASLFVTGSIIIDNVATGGNGGDENGSGGAGGSAMGGGVAAASSSPYFTNCTIDGNIATGGMGSTGFFSTPGGLGGNASGGGLYVVGQNIGVTACSLALNTATGGSGGASSASGFLGGAGGTGAGGGLYLDLSAAPNTMGISNITTSTFTSNSATGGEAGRGRNAGSGAGGSGLGGGLDTTGGDPAITDSVFVANSATGGIGSTGDAGAGGGVYATDSGGAIITSCTFTANSATGTTGEGGGLYNDGNSATTLTDDILFFDNDGEQFDNSGTISASYCDIAQSLNLNVDPLFVTPYTNSSTPFDLHLQANSPVAAAGSSSAPDFPPTDIGGSAWSNPPSIGAYQALALNPLTPTIATTQQPASTAVGSSVADKVTLSGGDSPGGTVTFNLYNNATATGTPLFSDTEILSSGTATSKGYATTGTGTDYWVATYSGDSNNNPVTSGAALEPVSITAAIPTIATTQQPASATVGSSIADKATVSGGYSPSGAVTFSLYSNATATGTPLFTDSETLTGGTATSKSFSTTATGTDYWVATYNGDGNNSAVTSGAALEPVTITPATPTISTAQQPASATVGSSIADKATVSGGYSPSGAVTFSLYSNATATGTPLFTDTETLSAGAATSKRFSTTATGTDFWVARYNGDANNSAIASGATLEPVTINPASPTISTTPQPASATVGTSIADKATVSGGYSPSGTVTFSLYSNSTATGTPLFTDSETLTGGTATSKGYTTTATGTDYWVARYNGDSNNSSVTSGAALEPVTVSSAAPTIAATAGVAVVVGTNAALTASATLSGGVSPTGSITFTLYSPTNAVVFTDIVTVAGNGTYSTGGGTITGSAVPTVAGTYQWVASYGGDANNKAATTIKGATPATAIGGGVTVVNGVLYLVDANNNTTSDLLTLSPVGLGIGGSTGVLVTGLLNNAVVLTLVTNQSLSSIYVNGFGGNDTVVFLSSLTIPTTIVEGDGNNHIALGSGNNTVTLGNGNNTFSAGDGNNTITLGNGTDTIQVGNGTNVIVAGGGNDQIVAGNGNNLIVGGLGHDTIQVGNGRNILIDGTVQLTQTGDTLGKVLSDWVQLGATTANVSSIRSRLKVTDNTTNANTLRAGTGLDWFWYTDSKDVVNKKATDVVN